MNAASIRTLIFNNPRSSDGYTQQVRDAVARYAQARRAEGVRWCDVEAETGVSGASMRLWMRGLSGGSFHQVMVVDQADDDLLKSVEPELVITTPSGFTLTGCTLDQAARLLQSLR